MARAPTSYGTVDTALRPAAQPIDTYARPAEPQRSGLRDLAASLSGLERSLDGYLEERQAKADEADKLRAIADHYRNNGEGYAEGVSSGSIPSFASPAYVDAYKAAEGQSLGQKLVLEAQAEYMKWGGKDGTDPAAFDKFASDFLAARIPAGTDPKVLKGLLPVVTQGMGTLQTQFHQDLAASVYKGNIEKHGVVTSQMIDQADTDGYARPEGTDYDGLWASLTATRDNALKVGARSDDYDPVLIKAITEKAVEKRDPGLLKLLDRTLPGATHALSDTAKGASAKLETMGRLEVLARQSQADSERRHEREEKAAKAATELQAIDLLTADPSKALPDTLLAEGSKRDPEFRIKVLDWQKKLSEGGVAEDPKALAKVYADIFGGGGMGAVTRALGDGTIRSAQSLKEATAYAKSLEDGGGPSAKILQGNTVSTILDTIAKRAPGADPMTNPFGAQGPSDAALQAQTEFKRALIDWAIRNPDASEMDKEKARSDIGRMILQGITQGSGDGAAYQRPTDQALRGVGIEPGALPQRPPAPPPAAPPASGALIDKIPAPPQAGTPQAAQPLPADPAVESFKGGFTAFQREAVDQRARARGLDPEVVWREIYRQKNQPAATVPHGSLVPMSYSPQGAAAPTAASSTGTPQRVAFTDPQVNAALATAATASGIDLGTLGRFAKIESGGDPGNVTGSYKGLFQLSDGEFAKYGPKGGDIFDPMDNAMAAGAKLKAEAARFSETFGWAPTPTDLYLVHNQGEAGYAAHLKNPSAPAWENMASTAEGRAKGDRWAKQAVWGNIPSNMRSLFPGGVDTVSSADFMSIWRNKVEGSPLPSPTPATASMTPEKSASWVKRFAAQFGVRL